MVVILDSQFTSKYGGSFGGSFLTVKIDNHLFSYSPYSHFLNNVFKPFRAKTMYFQVLQSIVTLAPYGLQHTNLNNSYCFENLGFGVYLMISLTDLKNERNSI